MALIEMRQITHRYSKNDAFILKDFSLSVEAGQHLAITGPSGSGKSTLLSILRQKKPGQLSGGQRQRVAIARALMGNPAVILADEPTAQLDGGTARMITELLLRRTSGGTALIFATHDLSLTEGFDQVVQLRS